MLHFIQTTSLNSLNQLTSFARLALRRQRYHLGLSLLTLFGVMLAVGLVTSASFFAQAVDTVMLREQMGEYSRLTGRPAFSTRVFAASDEAVPLSLDRVEALTERLSQTLAAEVGLPVRGVAWQANSGVLRLQTPGSDARGEQVNVIVDVGAVEQMEMVAGEPMSVAGRLSSGGQPEALAAWIYIDFAEETGTQPGDDLLLTSSGGAEIPVQIAGVWRTANHEEGDDVDRALTEALLTTQSSYAAYVEPRLDPAVRTATWQVVFDETAVVPAEGRSYRDGLESSQAAVQRFLPAARVTTPTLALGDFVQRQDTLTTLLLGFNVPGLAFLLYFLILTATVIAYWQGREMLVLLSRGMNRWHTALLTLLDGLILFVIGLPLGLLLGAGLARLMGYASSFLSFDAARLALPISRFGLNGTLVLLTLVVIIGTKLVALLLGQRRNLMQRRQEHVRPQRPPFWYRNYFDLLLLLPAAYFYRQLMQRGSLANLVGDAPSDLYRDPTLVLVPAIFIFVLALLSLRVFAWLLWLADRFTGRMSWLPLHMALRRLGRYSHTYLNPLLLVVVSLALGVYTLSLAGSLDRWLGDRVYYQTGADLAFEPFREGDLGAPEGGSTGAPWIPTVDEYAALDGVLDAARVGDYNAEMLLADGRFGARFLAIDRDGFADVAAFREDFAAQPLGALMNRLAQSPNSVLVSQQLLDATGLQVGDALRMRVFPDFGVNLEESFTIAGAYDYFPTVYEVDWVERRDAEFENAITVIGNLNHIFSFFGVTMPHDIWLRTAESASGVAIIDAIPDATGIDTLRDRDARALIRREQAQMERVGVFGTLSIGFLAAALMAAIGLLTYSYASLQERRTQFAVLRAVGIRHNQVLGQIVLEYAILTVFGAIAGIAAGTLAARQFVPLFRVTGDAQTALPPLLPIIAQGEVIPLTVGFVAVMLAAEVGLIAVALRGKLFQSLRLGER